MSEAQADIERRLESLGTDFKKHFEAAVTEQALRDENAKVLGKKGELTAILKEMGKVPAEARKHIGEKVNKLKQEVEAAFEGQLKTLRT
jgi:phenylalanyl-tRNA synthetase alpha chain